eukprot:364319-Chlamydomonas_euryale.AAC.8
MDLLFDQPGLTARRPQSATAALVTGTLAFDHGASTHAPAAHHLAVHSHRGGRLLRRRKLHKRDAARTAVLLHDEHTGKGSGKVQRCSELDVRHSSLQKGKAAGLPVAAWLSCMEHAQLHACKDKCDAAQVAALHDEHDEKRKGKGGEGGGACRGRGGQ